MRAERLPPPRGYWETVFRIGAPTGLCFGPLWSAMMAYSQGKPFIEVFWPGGLLAGVFFGVFFGLTMGYFGRGESAELAVDDEADFLDRLDAAAAEVGYKPAEQDGSRLTYKPTLKAGKASGNIDVLITDGVAEIVGPRMHLRKLRRRLEAADDE